jgi:hypothetical protein
MLALMALTFGSLASSRPAASTRRTAERFLRFAG